MASTAIDTQGATLTVDATPVGNLKSFSGFDAEASEIDVTNLSSQAKEKRAGLQDFGSFQLEWHPNKADTGQAAMQALQGTGALGSFVLTLPNTDTITFSAVVKNAYRMSGGVDAVIEGGAVLAVDGLPEFGP
jgi:hypothetical protein